MSKEVKPIEEDNPFLKEIMDEPCGCYGCGEDIGEKRLSEVFVDKFFWDIFAGVFCSKDCRDAYIESK